MVSIKDVAKHAGVAISTVSKVLNNYPNISEETRRKVNSSIEELQFVPNTIAAALSSKQPGRVALMINMITQTQAIDEIDMQYLSGALNKAKELGMDVVTVFFSMIGDMSAEEISVYLQSQNVTGIVIYGISRDDQVLHRLIAMEKFKIVVVDAPLVNSSTSAVWVDQRKAQMEVARKTILENTGDRVLYITGKKNGYVTMERLAGMKMLAQEMDLKLLVRCGNFSEKQARELTFKYAANRDVVVCASDLMAIGAMRALIEMDIFRPVCGFDGITLMGYAGKQMNTVRQDFRSMSSLAVEELHRLLHGQQGRQVIKPHTLVRMKYEDIIR